ncbi:efflux RND transporter periplasmic adaptor subunit [Bradyrhizobium sp. TZ2]
MNIVTEPKITGKPIADKPHKRPVRMVRWFIVVGTLLALLVGGLVWFNYFRGKMIAQFFANNKPRRPASASPRRSRNHSKSSDGGRRPRRRASGQCDVGRQRAYHRHHVHGGCEREEGTPLLQLFDGPEQADLANFKAQARVAQISLDRAKQLWSARSARRRPWIPRRRRSTRPPPASPRPRPSSRRSWCGRRSMANSAFSQGRGRTISTAGTQIVSLTDLSVLFANFTVTEKDSGQLKVGQIVRIAVDAYPGRTFEGKITTIEPQIATDTRNIRVQATMQNPDRILKPGMFATTTVVLPDKPPVVTVPETAVDYTLYGDSVFLISEKKEEDGKTSLIVTRSFVQTGKRIEGRAEILKGLKDGDRVVAVGQLKLQSGSAVTISTDPTPPIPAKPPRY